MCRVSFKRSDKENLLVPTVYKDNEDQILRCFLQSILEVDEGYIFYHSDKDTFAQTERVFAYEFYRKWANKVDALYNKKYLVNGEPEKSTSMFRTVNHKYPDLVLHHNQGDIRNQGIVCEVKRKEGFSTKSFRDDIEKLCYFVSKCDYKFQFGTFVLVGTNMSDIISAVSDIQKSSINFNARDNSFEKIVCITYNGCEMETVLMSQLINV